MIRGGLRTRLITDSLRLTVIAGLEQLGWFDPNRRHLPLRYIPRTVNWDVPIEPNCLAITGEDLTDDPYGLGDEIEDHLWCYVDIFAQDEQFGWHLARDIRDLLIGGLANRSGPVIDIYDFRQATPTPFTTVGIEQCIIDRGFNEAREWLNRWFILRVDLLDEYLDEFDAQHPTTTWTDDYVPAWARIQAAVESAP